MTFTDLLTVWREEVLADEDTGQFSDPDGYRLLKKAATEIAGALQLVRATDATITTLASATALTAPADLLAVFPGSLIIKGRSVELVSRDQMLRRRALPAGYPRYFSYDQDVGGNIEFAPATKYPITAGEAVLSYVKRYDGITAADGANVWDGKYPEWHYLVAYRAGIATFDMVELYERSGVFEQKFMTGIQMFAATLGRTSLARLMVPREARRDDGSVSK